MEKTSSNPDEDAVIAAELSLLDPRIRSSPTLVGALLADDFEEVGQSGRRWSRAEIIEHLSTETAEPGAPVITATNFQASSLSPDLILLTFETVAGESSTRRASLWRRTDDGWKLRYHQGTRVS